MPVTVRASFLLIAALIGFTGVGEIEETIAWIGIVFVSILIHELGHAFTARRYGSAVAIELNGLGGLTPMVGEGRRADTGSPRPHRRGRLGRRSRLRRRGVAGRLEVRPV